jgi:hypothetical protein
VRGQLTVRPQALDDALHARLADVPELRGTEIHAFDQAAGIDPFLAHVPALDTRRVQEVLPHVTAFEEMSPSLALATYNRRRAA